MATTVNTTTSANALISATWEKMALDKLELETPLYNISNKETVVPYGGGRTVYFTRLPLAQGDIVPTAEGAIPDGEIVIPSLFSTTLQQYTASVLFSDLLDETSYVEGGIEEQMAIYMAQKLRYTVQLLLQATVNSSTQTAGGNLLAPIGTSGGDVQANITASNVTKAQDLRRMRGRLFTAGVPKKGDKYDYLAHAATIFDITSQTAAGEWLDVSKRQDSGYAAINDSMAKDTGLIGGIFGMNFWATALMPTGTANDGTTIYYSYAIGDNALMSVNLGSKDRMTVIRVPGKPDMYNRAGTLGGAVSYNLKFASVNVSEGTSASTARIIRFGAASAQS